MIPRWLAGGRLRLEVAGIFAALAIVAMAPRPARAQGAGPGVAVELPVLGVKVEIPGGVGEWVVRKDDGGDVLQRTKPVNPYLSVLFSVPEAGAKASTCAATMASFAKKGLKKVDKPGLVPAGWTTQVLTATTSGEHLIAFCAESEAKDDERQLVALVTYSSSIDGPDLTNVTPIMEAVGKAVFARTGGADATANPAEKPAGTADTTDADSDDSEPQRLSLPRSKLLLLVGGGAEWEAKPGKGGRDLVKRVKPGEPALSVAIEVVRAEKQSGGCEAILDQYMATRSKSSLQNKPAYLPDDFHPNAAESYDKGIGRALTCAELPSGYLLATVAYSGSLDAEDARGARPVLVAAYHAATSVTEKAPTHHSIFSGRSFDSPVVFLGGQQIRPATEATNAGMIGNGTSFQAGVRQAGMLPFSRASVFGLAGRYQLQGGWDFQNDLVFDGSVAIGIGISIDRVTLMPMVGGGGDAIGAGAKEAADKQNMAFDVYNWYGGVIAVAFTDTVGIELTGGYLDRGPIHEVRYDGQIIVLPRSFRKVTLDVSYANISTQAKIWQLLVGVGF